MRKVQFMSEYTVQTFSSYMRCHGFNVENLKEMEKEITNVTLKHWKIPTCDMYDTVLCMIKTA